MVQAIFRAVKACKRITQIEASYPYPQEQQAAKATMSDGSSPSTATTSTRQLVKYRAKGRRVMTDGTKNAEAIWSRIMK